MSFAQESTGDIETTANITAQTTTGGSGFAQGGTPYTFAHGKKYLKFFLQPNCSIRQSKLKLLVLCTTYHDIVVFYARKLLQYLDKTKYNLRRSV